MLSQNAIQQILGIKDKVYLNTEDMVKKFKVTFYPLTEKASENILYFSEKLKKTLKELNVDIIQYDKVWENISLYKRIKRLSKYSLNNINWILRKILGLSEINFYIPLKSLFRLSGRKKIRKGICIICIGEQEIDNLPMQYISNFKDNSIITIVDLPLHINEQSQFMSHFNTAMGLFAYHMTNIVIAVNDSKWMIYNFNASHPIYKINDENFNQNVLMALIPKITAPITPHKFSEFNIVKERFDIKDVTHSLVINELKIGAQIFSKTNLYPAGKKIDELPFRHNFHRLIGKLHLDNRSGMSFGFLAFQMPTKIYLLEALGEFVLEHKNAFEQDDIYIDDNKIFVLVEINSNKLVIRIPDVWVMTLRSGADKTNFNINSDLLKLGLVNGKMWMQFPKGLKIDRDYKPSFDTKVILAHAVGNGITASILQYLNDDNNFYKNLKNNGLSISHWHGYFNKKYLPPGVDYYGQNNLHVSCSSPQSAIFALDGKLNSLHNKIGTPDLSGYNGDVHVEPHHGINITFPSVIKLAQYIIDNPEATELGNKFL